MEREHGSPEPGIGRRLREAREDRGLTFRQAERATKIRSRYLSDLEGENFGVLPYVYVLGSLKSYADFLGLDGAALSRELRARLAAPTGPEIPARTTDDGELQDEYEVAPTAAVGFDQLFLGMGVVLIPLLAVMTLVAAVVQGDRTPVSQVDDPSTPDDTSEISLAANVADGTATRDRRAYSPPNARDDGNKGEDGGRSTDENGRDRPGDDPRASKDVEDDTDRAGEEAQNPPQATSILGDAEFVPMPPSSPLPAETDLAASALVVGASPASTSAAAVASPASPAGASPTASVAVPSSATASPESSAGASPAPAPETPGANGAEPDYAPASPAPVGIRPAPDDGTGPVARTPFAVPDPAPGGTGIFAPSPGGVADAPGGTPDAGRISAGTDETLKDVLPDR